MIINCPDKLWRYVLKIIHTIYKRNVHVYILHIEVSQYYTRYSEQERDRPLKQTDKKHGVVGFVYVTDLYLLF